MTLIPPGLTSVEAARRLTEVGPNEPIAIARLSAAMQLARLFANPLVVILLVASGIAAALGENADAGIIIVMVLLGVVINFWQTYRSQRAADALRASVAPTATVLRDGIWQEIPHRVVVPGDVVRLSAGDLVPADARLLEARDLSVQEAVLTGESLPAEKARGNVVFLGTSIVSGTATAVIELTGRRTTFGGIAERLSARPPETEFDRGIHRFSLLILRTTIVLVFFILLAGIAMKRDPLESLLFAVALGVGLTPEFLPMIAAVTLTSGAIRMARQQVIVKHLPAIQNLGSIDILCCDKTGTLTSGSMQFDGAVDPLGAPSDRPRLLGYVTSRFETGIRSPLDVALLRRGDIDVSAYAKVDEIPFDFERRRLSVLADHQSGAGASRVLITKGAPEPILELSTAFEAEGRVMSLDPATREACRAVFERSSGQGLRVLAVAYRSIDRRDRYTRADERDLVLAGFLSFSDPVLPHAAETIAQLEQDGVTVKILTGDNDFVARHVCGEVHLDDRRLLTGDEISRLDDAALGHVAEQAVVFARMAPAQKNRIIVALKRRGHVVGFLGDGINDAPSLHAADVGISVTSATDIARDAAGIILRQADLRVLHRGIIEGRRASGNLMKYLLMGTSSNFGNMFSMAVASVFLPFLPMLPTQILLNNFLYDVAQLGIPADNIDREYLSRPERWDIGLIRQFMVFIGPISSIFDFLTFVVLLRWLQASEAAFHTGWFIESLATQTLVLFVVRTFGNPFRSRPAVVLAGMVVGAVATGAVLPITPLGQVLGFVPLPPRYFAFLVVATVSYLVLVELAKRPLVRHLGIGRVPARAALDEMTRSRR